MVVHVNPMGGGRGEATRKPATGTIDAARIGPVHTQPGLVQHAGYIAGYIETDTIRK